MTWPTWGWKAIAGVAVVLAVVQFGCEQRNQGVLAQQIKDTEARVKARDQVIAALAKQKARVDTVKAKAKVVYLTAKTSYDSARAVEPTTPFTIVADSAIHACSLVLLSCEQQVAVRDSLLDLQRAQIADLNERVRLEKKRKPSHFGCAGPGVVSTKGVGLGVGCGLKF